MPKENQKQEDDQQSSKKRNQVYDASFKGIFELQAHLMIPHLIAGAEYVETLDIEIIQFPMRADRVQKILLEGQPHISHFECQVGRDTNLPARMLMYCSKLYHDHHLPVISTIIYPFPTLIAKPPFRVMSGKREILKLDFETLLLFEEDATNYVEAHVIVMYPFLPCMKRVNATLVRQACEEMKTYYRERDEESIFKDLIVWMDVFLDGPNKIKHGEKQKIKEVLKMYGLDRLWEENPRVQQTFAAGKAEGIAEGQLEAARSFVESTANIRFPSLTDLVHQKVSSLTSLDELHALHEQIMTAPNEEVVRRLLLPQEPS
jgi:hypothetical protein